MTAEERGYWEHRAAEAEDPSSTAHSLWYLGQDAGTWQRRSIHLPNGTVVVERPPSWFRKAVAASRRGIPGRFHLRRPQRPRRPRPRRSRASRGSPDDPDPGEPALELVAASRRERS